MQQPKTFEECTQVPLKQATLNILGAASGRNTKRYGLGDINETLTKAFGEKASEPSPDEETEDSNPENATENSNEDRKTDTNDRYKKLPDKMQKAKEMLNDGPERGQKAMDQFMDVAGKAITPSQWQGELEWINTNASQRGS
jgi:hypothetical protein